MSGARLGYGTLFQTESLNSPNDWTTVAEVFNIGPPALSREVLDLSFGNAPNEWRVSIPGMPGASEMQIDFNFIPGGTAYNSLKLEMEDQLIRRRRLLFVGGLSMEFDAYLTSLSSEVPVDSHMKATAKFTVTGEVDPIS
jgi:hypothetical protein